MSTLKICLVSSEVTPFSKTGGLADVLHGLGRYLGAAGVDVRIFTPLYDSVARGGHRLEPDDSFDPVGIDFGGSKQHFQLQKATLPESEVPVWFIDCPAMFGRDQLYSSTYQDEHIRFGLLSRAAIEACQHMGWIPDVFHCNDWHTGLLPLYLKSVYAWDEKLKNSKTLLTIHNIGYQGQFAASVLEDLGLKEVAGLLHQEDLRRDQINFLKTGLIYSDHLSTVSETYAREIQEPDGGRGLEGILSARADHLSGIVNGVDYGDWSPQTDPNIPANFSAKDLSGKKECRDALLDRMNLKQADGTPVIGVVSRLTPQKGFDLLPDILPVLLRERNLRLCILGSGEQRYEEYFQWLRDRFPDQVGIYRGYHEELAHWIEAGSDMFLMPSMYEPCGLNQMYSLRYGTVPIVRRTGGLADTVQAWDGETGTGFSFDDYEPQQLLDAIRAACSAFDSEKTWATIQQNGMSQDFSWEKQGPLYEKLYKSLISG
ncbi:MAG: glycogen synthase GlgA [Planctomycetota bacterium]